jgi:hypothetical protein
MINAGPWRWPIIVGVPVLAGGLLFWRGMARLHYEGQAVLAYSGDAKDVDSELNIFRSHGDPSVAFAKVPGQPLAISLRSHGAWPEDVLGRLRTASQDCVRRSFDRQRDALSQISDGLQKQVGQTQSRLNELAENEKVILAAPRRGNARRSAAFVKKINELDRQINETKLRLDYFSRLYQETIQAERTLRPSWRVTQAIPKPKWPTGVDGWPLLAGVVLGLAALGFVVLKKKERRSSSDGLWRPEASAPNPSAEIQSMLESRAPENQAPEAAVELEIVSPEANLPSDALTEKAASLYARWIEVSKVLYQPAVEAPQGVLDSVSPLLQESSEFLPEGHDAMARYLARSVDPGNLAAHVARTVLMTLTGAEEAGVSPEHRQAMALAALFHDLAVVPRLPAGREALPNAWTEVGSQIGRLSATVLRRIPGLEPELLAMVEEILIGMDEFKLETWQNVANGSNLEPLSKVLREIDRFEKVMQKQKSRLDRRVANQ